jgi:hypothetical protein
MTVGMRSMSSSPAPWCIKRCRRNTSSATNHSKNERQGSQARLSAPGIKLERIWGKLPALQAIPTTSFPMLSVSVFHRPPCSASWPKQLKIPRATDPARFLALSTRSYTSTVRSRRLCKNWRTGGKASYGPTQPGGGGGGLTSPLLPRVLMAVVHLVIMSRTPLAVRSQSRRKVTRQPTMKRTNMTARVLQTAEGRWNAFVRTTSVC